MFSPFLNRYFVYADVTFDEFSIYFKSQSSHLSPFNPINTPRTFNVPFACDPLTVSPPPSIPVPQSASPPPPCDSTQVPTTLSPPALTPKSDLPIALQKGMCSTVIPLPIIFL